MEQQLHSCLPLHNESTAGAKVDLFIRGVLASLAMLDYPVATNFVVPLPANPVQHACQALENQSDPMVGLRKVTDLFLNGTGSFKCYDYMAEMVGRVTDGRFLGPKVQPDMGNWQYQACNEMILETLTSDGFGFYPPTDAQVKEVTAACESRYGVTPRPEWLPLSLGASDLRVGQLLFTDGEKDPWHTGAPRLDPSLNLDIVHHMIPGAAHHEDLRFDPPNPRPAVVAAKKLARQSIRRWVAQAAGHGHGVLV